LKSKKTNLTGSFWQLSDTSLGLDVVPTPKLQLIQAISPIAQVIAVNTKENNVNLSKHE